MTDFGELAANYVIQESSIIGRSQIEYWHVNILSNDFRPISGGFARDKTIARKIAYVELLERRAFEKIKNSKEDFDSWGLHLVPTGCGFAAGFDQANTLYRSLGEAVERWVLSKSEDENFGLEAVSVDVLASKLDSGSLWFIEQFERVLFFKKEVIALVGDIYHKITVVQTIAIHSGGAFLGMGSSVSGSGMWQHALLESYRHKLIFMNVAPQESFFDKRIRFFAENAQVPLGRLEKMKKQKWPIARLMLRKCEYLAESKIFLARTILEGWKSWHQGPVTRFLY